MQRCTPPPPGRAYTWRVVTSSRPGLLILIATAVAALLLAGCAASPDDAAERGADGLPVVRLHARHASALAEDPATLAASFDAVFSGEVIAEGGQRRLEPGEDDQRPLPLSVFLVRVEASAGAPVPGSVVEVEQLGGVTAGGDGPVRVLVDGDTLMEPGGRYLLVASEEGPATYSAASFARFPVEDGLVTAPEGWEETGASRELAGLTVAEAMARLGG